MKVRGWPALDLLSTFSPRFSLLQEMTLNAVRSLVCGLFFLATVASTAAIPADLQGTVTAVKGQRATLKTANGEVTVSLPAGTVLKAGDKVSVSVESVGDALRARKVTLRRD